MRSRARAALVASSLLALSLLGGCGKVASTPALDTRACASDAPERQLVPTLDATVSTEIQGMRYDEFGCFHPMETAGTRTTTSDGGAPCAEVLTEARDSEGNCWRFLNSCLPDGFTEIPSTDPPTESCTVVDRICVDSLSCADDLLATSAGCLTCDQLQSALGTRLAATKSQYDACSVDADCAMVPPGIPCANDCGAAVSASRVDAYKQAVVGLYPDYCTDPLEWAVTCQAIPVECPASHAICTAGHCIQITP